MVTGQTGDMVMSQTGDVVISQTGMWEYESDWDVVMSQTRYMSQTIVMNCPPFGQKLFVFYFLDFLLLLQEAQL